MQKQNSPKKCNHFALLFLQFKCSFENSIAILLPFHCLNQTQIMPHNLITNDSNLIITSVNLHCFATAIVLCSKHVYLVAVEQ